MVTARAVRTRTHLGLGGHARRAIVATGDCDADAGRGTRISGSVDRTARPRTGHPAAPGLLGLTLAARAGQPEHNAPTLRCLDEITRLFEDLTKIVNGAFGQPECVARSP